MQDFKPSDLESEAQSRTTQIRHGDRLFSLIERASISLAVDKSVFLRAAIAREAERVLERQSRDDIRSTDRVFCCAATP